MAIFAHSSWIKFYVWLSLTPPDPVPSQNDRREVEHQKTARKVVRKLITEIKLS